MDDKPHEGKELYEPYQSRFEAGDCVRLKPRNELEELHAALSKAFKRGEIAEAVYWIPGPEFFERAAGRIFAIQLVYSWHCGVPLLILFCPDAPDLRYPRLFEGFFEPVAAADCPANTLKVAARFRAADAIRCQEPAQAAPESTDDDVFLTEQEIDDIIRDVLEEAKDRGADESQP